MTANERRVMQECSEAAHTGSLSFPEIVHRLAVQGVERYHADYAREEITYYLATGESLVVPNPQHDAAAAPQSPIADTFSSEGVATAVRQSQRNEHTYLEFLRKTRQAGCVGYFVQITGRRALYFGRRGETHVELFPGPPPPE